MDSHVNNLGLPKQPILICKIVNLKTALAFPIFTSDMSYKFQLFWRPGSKEKKKQTPPHTHNPKKTNQTKK